MKDKRYLSLLSDTTFKYLIRTPNGRLFVNKLVYYITNEDISSFTLVDNEYISGNKKRNYRMDILFQSKDKRTIVNIELNRNPDRISVNRNYLYSSKIASDLFFKSEKVEDFRIIQINIDNTYSIFEKGIEKDKYVIKNANNNMFKYLELYYIFLPYYKDISYNGSNEYEMFLSMFNAKSFKELKRIIGNNKEGELIMTELEKLSLDEGIIGLYDYEEDQRKISKAREEVARTDGLEEGKSIGLEEGKNIGIEKGIKQVASNMLKLNIPIDDIKKATGLTVKEINNLTN